MTPSERAVRFDQAKRALLDHIYGNLNAEQREAGFSVDGPLLVLAGAGSGKTTVLVRRIAFLIRFGDLYHHDSDGNELTDAEVLRMENAFSLDRDLQLDLLGQYAYRPTPPWSVLSITFTNKAAGEMKERLEKEIGDAASEIMSGTFHSVCVRILRRFGEKIGINSNFTIYDQDDSKRVISNIIKDLRIDDKIVSPKAAMNVISRAKDSLVTPAEFSRLAVEDFQKRCIAKIYSEYEKQLTAANAVDFDNIIVKTVELLEKCPDVLAFYQKRWKYVSVDEYQDTNHAQFVLTKLLADGYRNLMVVGDDDQSIYRFRGATIENILHFDDTYPDAKVIRLETNYRSTRPILDAANAVISHNVGRKGKTLRTDRTGGDKIVLKHLDNQNAEADYIAREILSLKEKEGRAFSDFAILYRMNAQSNILERVLVKSGIPYRVLGGTRFYERKEIKDVMAYMWLIHNPSDDLRLKRIINEPKRKIGTATLDAVSEIAAFENKSMFEVISHASDYSVLSAGAQRLLAFADLINRLRACVETDPLSELFRKTISMTGYAEMLEKAGITEKDRLENIEELVSNAVEFENSAEDPTLAGFLEEISLVADIDNYDPSEPAVVLMTIHSAKGLEFPIVFLPAMENGIFPSMMAQSSVEEIEEERRLAYVAITRAKDRLFMTLARERLIFGRTQYNPPSQFLKELPPEVLIEEKPEKPKMNAYNAEYHRQTGASMFRENTIPHVRTIDEAPKTDFRVGDRVHHATFGDGTVLSVRPMSADTLYEIMFDSVGTKKLMKTYARLTKAQEANE